MRTGSDLKLLTYILVGKFFGNFTKPFDIQFGRLVTKIRNLQQTIEDDARAGALVMQVVQTKSLTRHRVDLSLRRNHYEACLMGKSPFCPLLGDRS